MNYPTRQLLPSRSLIGYAVLRANFNYDAPSYLQAFRPFVIDGLRHADGPCDKFAVGAHIRSEYGFTIPDAVVGKLLGREAVKNTVTRVSDKEFTLTPEQASKAPDIRSEAQAFSRQQNELASKFATFVARELPDLKLQDSYARTIATYIEKYAVPLLNRAMRGTRTDADRQAPEEYAVATFVDELSRTDAAAFEYIVDAVKGAILATVVELPVGNLQQRLEGLTLFLDTPILIKLLGYQGVEHEAAATDVVRLAGDLGAKLACFDHTLQELDGILEQVEYTVKNRGGRSGRFREVDLHFLSIKASAADVKVARDGVERRMRGLGIEVRARPDDYRAFGLDEAKLDDLLQEHVGYARENTRIYDLKSISAVHRLRRGSAPTTIENTEYLFITDNTAVVRAAFEVSKVEGHAIPLAMTDGDIAALLWVRSPSVASDLPREQLLATVHAGMQPGSHLWGKYLSEVEVLLDRADISEDDAVILRASGDAHRALMDITLGEAKELNDETVHEVLQRVREHLTGPARAELEATASERDTVRQEKSESEQAVQALRRQVQDLQRERDEQSNRLTETAKQKARRLVNLGTAVTIVLALTVAMSQAIAPERVGSWPDYVQMSMKIVGALTFGAALVCTLLPESSPASRRWLVQRLARRISSRAHKNAGLS